jgi:hypothetical protein
MRVVDLDGVMFVPVVDETHGGAVVEMKMTVGEFFEKCCAGFAPEVVEAIPVAWLEKWKQEPALQQTVHNILLLWNKEQEAR